MIVAGNRGRHAPTEGATVRTNQENRESIKVCCLTRFGRARPRRRMRGRGERRGDNPVAYHASERATRLTPSNSASLRLSPLRSYPTAKPCPSRSNCATPRATERYMPRRSRRWMRSRRWQASIRLGKASASGNFWFLRISLTDPFGAID